LIVSGNATSRVPLSLGSLALLSIDRITAEWSGLEGVWSVHIYLDEHTFVGVSCAAEHEIPEAKQQVLARCAEILAERG